MHVRNFPYWLIILIFFSFLACSKKPNNELKALKGDVLLAKKDSNFYLNRVQYIDKNNPNVQDSLFVNKHTLPISNNDWKLLENNVDYKYPLLLNNRERGFDNGDTTFYFSKNFNSIIGFLESDLNRTGQYNLMIFNKEHKLIGNVKTDELESDETNDGFRPFDNGDGFVQFANRLGCSMNLRIFELSDGKYIENISLKSETARLHSVCVSESGRYIGVITQDKDKIFTLEKLSINGTSYFSKKLQNIDILATSLYITNNGKYISYYYKKILNNNLTESWYSILNEKGEMILDIPVFHIGNYPAKDIKYNETEYLIAEGHKVYIIDLTHRKLIKEIGGINEQEKAYRVYVNNNNLYVLFIEYKFQNNRKVQGKKYLQQYDIPTGNITNTIIIPFLGEISLFLENKQFYIKLVDSDIKNTIYKLKF